MSRLRDLLVLAGVACAVPGAILVLGQVQDVVLPPPPAVVLPRPAEKKQEEPAKPVVAKKQREAEKKATEKSKVAVKAVVVRPDRVPAPPPAAVLNAQAAQYEQQFQLMFRAEYYFIRNTCGLNTDQRKQLARLEETAVKAAARSFVEA